MVDLGAQNGTWHNGMKLIEGARQRLRHNDILGFGKAAKKFKFVSTAMEAEEREADSDDVPAPLYSEAQYQYPGYNTQGVPMQ